MTEADRKIDAFRLLYGAVTLPFGGVLGALLANVGTQRTVAGVSEVPVGTAMMLGFSLIALFAFFAAVPVACEGIIRRRLPPGRFSVPLIVLVLVWCTAIMPTEQFGISYRIWLSVISAWLVCCLALCWLCHSANIKKSMLR